MRKANIRDNTNKNWRGCKAASILSAGRSTSQYITLEKYLAISTFIYFPTDLAISFLGTYPAKMHMCS